MTHNHHNDDTLKREKMEIKIDSEDAIDNFGIEIFEQNILLFVDEGYHNYKEGIKKGQEEKDHSKIKILTHTLKTTARYMSSENFAQECHAIEMETKIPNWDKINFLLTDFFYYLDVLYNECIKFYNQYKPENERKSFLKFPAKENYFLEEDKGQNNNYTLINGIVHLNTNRITNDNINNGNYETDINNFSSFDDNYILNKISKSGDVASNKNITIFLVNNDKENEYTHIIDNSIDSEGSRLNINFSNNKIEKHGSFDSKYNFEKNEELIIKENISNKNNFSNSLIHGRQRIFKSREKIESKFNKIKDKEEIENIDDINDNSQTNIKYLKPDKLFSVSNKNVLQFTLNEKKNNENDLLIQEKVIKLNKSCKFLDDSYHDKEINHLYNNTKGNVYQIENSFQKFSSANHEIIKTKNQINSQNIDKKFSKNFDDSILFKKRMEIIHSNSSSNLNSSFKNPKSCIKSLRDIDKPNSNGSYFKPKLDEKNKVIPTIQEFRSNN